ncbi:sensor histidine kinase [Romboutsia sp. Marseille-P6047]|uniref:sensor histidine kinase n=1 Tax=Romboutsia sp. Marseille-P6047 TaxID=2161817 RepID=UPI000F050005|nr:sensor histidine kinase [Romboutsia sp. Marseille-P6047]
MLEKLNIELWDIINIATGTVDWIIFFLSIDSFGKRKLSNIKYILGIMFIFILMGSINVSGINPNTKIIICMIVGGIFYSLFYKDKIYKCVLVTLLFWLGLILAEGLAVSIVVMMNELNNINIILNGNLFRIEAIIVSKIFLSITLIIFKYFKLSLDFKPKDMILISLPLLSNIVSLLLIFGYNLKSDGISTEHIIMLVFTTALIVLSSIVLLIVIRKIIEDDKVKLEYELINERIKTNHKNYENIYDIYDRLKFVYHDLKNHMICMKGYDTKEEIISYINNLENQIGDFEKVKNTGNKTLDIILGEKIHLCKKHNIKFEDNINISKLGFIKDIDICAIFANAIDNAIEACVNIDNEIEKRIEVKATYINGFSIIKFINSKVNDIRIIDERIKTSKDDEKIHGIGLASIEYIVDKYDGEVVVNYSDNEFILKIMIPIGG